MRAPPHIGQRDWGWQYLVVYVAIAGLVITLATRFPDSSSLSLSATVQTSGLHAKVQHRDKDALSWASPAPRFLLLWSARPSPLYNWLDEPLLTPPVECALFNRPPPVS